MAQGNQGEMKDGMAGEAGAPPDTTGANDQGEPMGAIPFMVPMKMLPPSVQGAKPGDPVTIYLTGTLSSVKAGEATIEVEKLTDEATQEQSEGEGGPGEMMPPTMEHPSMAGKPSVALSVRIAHKRQGVE